MDPATGAAWPRLPISGGSGFRPRLPINGPRPDQTVLTVPPNTPVENVPRPLSPAPLLLEEAILQLDGHGNVGYQSEEGPETEVAQGGPAETTVGPDPEPVSKKNFLNNCNF